MIVSFTLIFLASILFYRITQRHSFILIILSLTPFLQCLLIFYGNYFVDNFFAENFRHYSLMKENDIQFILLNYVVYLGGVDLFSFLLHDSNQLNNLLRSVKFNSLIFSLDKLVVIFSFITLLFLISNDLNNILSKVMRLIFYYISFVPLLVGYFILQIKKRTLILFSLVVLFFVVINLLIGSRGYMATITGAITLGLLANGENRKIIRYYLVIVILVIISIFPFLGFIEIFRSEYGRIEYEEVDQDRLELLAYEFQDKKKYEKSTDTGLARSITWPNLSVMLMTGKEVETIGFNNLKNDLTFILTNTFISGKSVENAREEYIERLWGTGPANLYGYTVNLSNSVEFSAFADGIWRYGRFGFLYNLAILILIGLFMEKALLRRVNSDNISLFALMLAGNIYLIFITTVNGEPLISIIRALIYTSVFSYFLSMVLTPFTRKDQA